MRVPLKFISVLSISLCISWLTIGVAGASADPHLIDVSVDTSCSADGIVSLNVWVTNVSGAALNVQLFDVQTNGYHDLVDMPASQRVLFEFSTAVPTLDGNALSILAAVPGHEDDEAFVQVIERPYTSLDCRNAHEPADSLPYETTTTLVNPTTSTTALNPTTTVAPPPSSTTTSTTQPEAQASSTSIVRDTTTVAPTTTLQTTPVAELAYTGSGWISLQAKIALTTIIVGAVCVYISWSMRRNKLAKRRQQRRDKITAVNKD